ncbi:MAG: Lrp/AsnC family transcriptional regulator [Sphingomonadaceae bacterium]|uniref:Lrp/AsnC family transcriptional regulator n=1 Tax=Thermaurantiacus sp. TaxID=2820283 RepID=UPI00298EFB2E|nr:Lrp/AsnC family transcriptional regulator [Thermaurantiacus sp.]MCS6987625.1 Lrp/AsnC family transcriptional regulator [Sphingomonadaceae bacterium]MDW8415226.1 Lrp/AsnC family transcriptional regulator [Thermaurantiacus sp.]
MHGQAETEVARPRRSELDRIDRFILRTLQEEGRITNVELARRAGLTAPPCLRRVRALEQAGIIRGYHADIAPEAVGWPVTVFAFVSLKSQAEDDLRAFEAYVASLPEVRECHMLSGETDFLLRIVARDLPGFQAFLSGKLTTAPNVASVKTSLTLRTSKTEVGVPVEV